MDTDDKDFELLMKQGYMFHQYLGRRTCKTCAYAMPFKNSVVCGVWHSSFSIKSFCDHYKTEDERKAELDIVREKIKSDPNSLYNRIKSNNTAK